MQGVGRRDDLWIPCPGPEALRPRSAEPIVDKAVPDSAEAEKKLLFLPGQLTNGIEESDDPLIDIRAARQSV